MGDTIVRGVAEAQRLNLLAQSKNCGDSTFESFEKSSTVESFAGSTIESLE